MIHAGKGITIIVTEYFILPHHKHHTYTEEYISLRITEAAVVDKGLQAMQLLCFNRTL